ncbi:unnamed protein product [Prorocentrum cordatum]|uniref:Uncharacterized protein n=1 Tax=Prorocentrum cordatum TaxID=2364126 RepID=A0ABN9XB14_9DINO|nr:unnamed protein product [Polarella glacialis]
MFSDGRCQLACPCQTPEQQQSDMAMFQKFFGAGGHFPLSNLACIGIEVKISERNKFKLEIALGPVFSLTAAGSADVLKAFPILPAPPFFGEVTIAGQLLVDLLEFDPLDPNSSVCLVGSASLEFDFGIDLWIIQISLLKAGLEVGVKYDPNLPGCAHIVYGIIFVQFLILKLSMELRYHTEFQDLSLHLHVSVNIKILWWSITEDIGSWRLIG